MFPMIFIGLIIFSVNIMPVLSDDTSICGEWLMNTSNGHEALMNISCQDDTSGNLLYSGTIDFSISEKNYPIEPITDIHFDGESFKFQRPFLADPSWAQEYVAIYDDSVDTLSGTLTVLSRDITYNWSAIRLNKSDSMNNNFNIIDFNPYSYKI